MGPSTVAFLKDVYARAKAAGKFNMKQQPDMKFTWNTMVASTYWDMRLSVACTATDAEFQNRIIIRDHTMNLPVVARQPHPDPNHAPHTAPRPPVAGAPNRRPLWQDRQEPAPTGRLGARELPDRTTCE